MEITFNNPSNQLSYQIGYLNSFFYLEIEVTISDTFIKCKGKENNIQELKLLLKSKNLI